MRKKIKNKNYISSQFAKKYIYYYYAFFWLILIIYLLVK